MSDLRIFGARTHTLRTSFDLKLVLGLPYHQHNLPPFVAEPFHFSLKSTARGGLTEETAQQDNEAGRQPISTVFNWQRGLDEAKAQAIVPIGEQEGLSKARMTQMFSLLHLPKDAQNYLAEMIRSTASRAGRDHWVESPASTFSPRRFRLSEPRQ